MNEKKPTIALLGGMNLTKQNIYRTGIKFLEEQFEVIVLDCRPLLKRHIDPSIEVDPGFKIIYQVTTQEDLVRILGDLKPVYAVDFIGPCQEMKLIQPALRNIDCKFVIQMLGILPSFGICRRILYQFLRSAPDRFRKCFTFPESRRVNAAVPSECSIAATTYPSATRLDMSVA